MTDPESVKEKLTAKIRAKAQAAAARRLSKRAETDLQDLADFIAASEHLDGFEAYERACDQRPDLVNQALLSRQLQESGDDRDD